MENTTNEAVVTNETNINNSKDYISFLETTEQETFTKEEVLATLKGFKKGSGKRRGQLAGISLEDMSDEQLKREIINAKSVLYKAQQRDAAAETIEKNEARVEAALAEKAKRAPEATENADGTPLEGEVGADVYEDADIANEL